MITLFGLPVLQSAPKTGTAMHRWAFGRFGLTSARAEVHRDKVASRAIARRPGGIVDAGQRPVWMMDRGSVYLFAGAAA